MQCCYPQLPLCRLLHVPADMMAGLKEGQEKMSKSDPDSAIFMEDSEADVKRKIRQAYCPPGVVEGNPCLDWMKHIVFGKHEEGVTVRRKPDNGGDRCVPAAASCLFAPRLGGWHQSICHASAYPALPALSVCLSAGCTPCTRSWRRSSCRARCTPETSSCASPSTSTSECTQEHTQDAPATHLWPPFRLSLNCSKAPFFAFLAAACCNLCATTSPAGSPRSCWSRCGPTRSHDKGCGSYAATASLMRQAA